MIDVLLFLDFWYVCTIRNLQLLNVLALGILASVIRHPVNTDAFESDYDELSHTKEILPTPLSKVESPYPYRDQSMR